MTVDVLSDGVDDDIGTVVQRVLNVGAQEGVIDDNQDTVLVGHGSDLLDIDQAEGGVGGGFDPDQLGLVGADELLDVEFDARRESHLDTMGGGNLGEVPVGSTIDIGDGDDVRARGERLKDDGGGCGARGEGKGIFGVFKSGNGLLEVVTGFQQVNNPYNVFSTMAIPIPLTGWGSSCGCIRRDRRGCRRWFAQRWWRGRSITS